MKAVQVKAYGEINDVVVVDDIKKPTIEAGKVLVKVHAASVNPLDNVLRAGYMKDMMPMDFPYVTGSDGAGIVVEVADDIATLSVGDEVFYRPDYSEAATFAEFQLVSADAVAKKPSTVSLLESAAIPQVSLTAYQALLMGGEVKGKKVLIHGGAGGVGSQAIQLAKILGASEIITTAESEQAEQLKQKGADQVIDFRTQNFSELVSEIDIVIDTIGGEVQEKSIKVTKPGGSVITLLGVMFEELANANSVILELLFHQANGAHLAWIAQQVDEGKLSTKIDTTFAANDVKKALAYVEQGKARGKVVVDFTNF
ncbi:NADP-dependent oxidoreductase [Moritella sp. F3]|uniref:NADP-dependent oxidoreductase n=1 Tax=Moritella sp. F3 TaxID=2718882 RepID=UPI0018E0FC47|nr:NADP-dependent oxidoreductase [Moritella sp. F3]GIC77020.1 NADPH:quinone reductase [Moritella sp. F1]GIC80202.1 NADPH:quinone reductase [Moritella sp. F3]